MTHSDDTRSELMDAFHHEKPVAAKAVARQELPDLEARLTDVDLNERIRSGWDVWCDLLDELLSAGGMLPAPQLAARAVEFFEGEYWRAEDARIEALRREIASRRVGHSRTRDQVRGLG
jgi:hypothetical protein